MNIFLKLVRSNAKVDGPRRPHQSVNPTGGESNLDFIGDVEPDMHLDEQIK